MIYEENPFEEKRIAQEWIKTIENERGTIRDKEIDPFLLSWLDKYNPRTVLDIGCGQGIYSEKLSGKIIEYVGIDPSSTLIERAHERYRASNRKFIIGNVYEIPLASETVDAAFSITVWFHLKNLAKASEELSRVLKSMGQFVIITADPESYDVWETHYREVIKDESKLVGKAKVLLNPDESRPEFSEISKNTFYFHKLQDIKSSLTSKNLIVENIDKMGYLEMHKGRNLFVLIRGYKSK